MPRLLSTIHSPKDLNSLSLAELNQLADEIRQEICAVVARRSAHFASNLGIVELTIALHSVFDFSRDRLVWDVGHQTYPHKLLTGRADRFATIRTKGGLMGYPDPAESPFDLFMTGHAGCSISSALGLSCGDDLLKTINDAMLLDDQDRDAQKRNPQNYHAKNNDFKNLAPNARDASLPPRRTVAVIGDGSFSSGVVFEGLNHLGELRKNITVVLNDNKMSICPRVGSFGQYLDSLRMNPFYTEMKADMKQLLQSIPLVGKSARSRFHDLKMAFKACVSGGMLFEEMGIRYIGPVDGHNIRQLQKFLRMTSQFQGPVLLHVLTRKGHGFSPAEHDPAKFHSPSPLLIQGLNLPGTPTVSTAPSEASAESHLTAPSHRENLACRESALRNENSLRSENAPKTPISIPKPQEDRSYTVLASKKIMELMERNPKIVVITAAMCQGNKLEQIRQRFPRRFFDVGICESHAVVLAAGMAKAGLRPIVDVYSTFMQRAYDHIFQEISLQNLHVALLMDRAGLVGADGPTHHGAYDLAYLRPFPNLSITAPCDEQDLEQLLELAVTHPGPFSIRYSKTQTPVLDGVPRKPVEWGKAELLQKGLPGGGLVVACGVQTAEAMKALRLAQDDSTALVNLRFIKPLDMETILPLARQAAWILAVEEGCRMGGAASALLEALADAQLQKWFPLPPLMRLGMEDRFIPHASRAEQLEETGLDATGILKAILRLKKQYPPRPTSAD